MHAAPDSEPRPATALLGGALAGSGPGTSPCIDGLSLVTGMVVPKRAFPLKPAARSSVGAGCSASGEVGFERPP